MSGFPWQRYQDDLERLAGEGLSAGEIACELSAAARVPVSRNGVISRLYRTGVWKKGSGRAAAIRAEAAGRRTAAKRSGDGARAAKKPAAKPAKPGRALIAGGAGFAGMKTGQPKEGTLPAESVEDAAIPSGQRLSLMQINERTCKWPVGEPGAPGFFFCGAQRAEGQIYCAGHCARAYPQWKGEAA